MFVHRAPWVGAVFAPLVLMGALLGETSAQRVKGLERGSATAPLRLDDIDPATCALTRCALPSPPLVPHVGFHGGTAFDTGTGHEWSSDGAFVIRTDQNCASICGWDSRPDSPSPITGVALNRQRKWIYTSHEDGFLRIWDNACVKALRGQCHVSVAAGSAVTGIEYDCRNLPSAYPNGRLFCITNTGVLIILAEPVPVTGACSELCRVTIPRCTGFGAPTGLGYDPRLRVLYVTDGALLLRLSENQCAVTLQGCCTVAAATPLSGLGFHRGPPVVTGGGCAELPCMSCVALISTEGYPSVTNGDSKVKCGGSRSGSNTVIVMALGAATNNLPFLCGRIYIPLSPLLIALPTSNTGTGTGCTGQAVAGLGFLPASAVGIDLSFQGATLCPTPTGIGGGLSAGLTLRVEW